MWKTRGNYKWVNTTCKTRGWILFLTCVSVGLYEENGDEVGHNWENVDDIRDLFDELTFLGGTGESGTKTRGQSGETRG